MSTAVWHRGHTFLSVIDTGPPSGGAIAAGAPGGVGGTGGGDGGCTSCFRARRSPKIRNTRSTTAIRTAAMRAIGDCRVRAKVCDALPWAPNGSSTSTRRTTFESATSRVVQTTEVAPTWSVRSGIVSVPIVTLAHTWRYDDTNTLSDTVQENVTDVAASMVWPAEGATMATMGEPFAGSPGSVPREKSCGPLVSEHAASRWRIRPGPGAGASPMIVLPGSQVKVPPLVALNSTRSTTMSRPPAGAEAPRGFL